MLLYINKRKNDYRKSYYFIEKIFHFDSNPSFYSLIECLTFFLSLEQAFL